jgi:hypothetical protein
MTTRVVLYRFAWIKSLRILLRAKLLQLTAGVGICVPALQIYSAGGTLGLYDYGVIAAFSGGTIAVGSTLSWYARRFAGEIAFLPKSDQIEVSTLTMAGHRLDRQYASSDVGQSLPASTAETELQSLHGAHMVPLNVDEHTYMLVGRPPHVREPAALAALLAGRGSELKRLVPDPPS